MKKIKLKQVPKKYSNENVYFEYDKITKNISSEKWSELEKDINLLNLLYGLIGFYWIDNPEFFEEIKEKKSVYDLGLWDKYFMSNNRIEKNIYNKDKIDDWLIRTWEAFLTQKEVRENEIKKEYRESIRRWIEVNDDGYEFKIGNINSAIISYNGKIQYEDSCKNYRDWVFYFSCTRASRRCYKELKTEWDYLLKIK